MKYPRIFAAVLCFLLFTHFASAKQAVVELALRPAKLSTAFDLARLQQIVPLPGDGWKRLLQLNPEEVHAIIFDLDALKQNSNSTTPAGLVLIKAKDKTGYSKYRAFGDWLVPVDKNFDKYSNDEIEVIIKTLTPMNEQDAFWLRANMRPCASSLEKEIKTMDPKAAEVAQALLPVMKELNTVEFHLRDTKDNLRFIFQLSSIQSSHLAALFTPQPAAAFPPAFNGFSINKSMMHGYVYYNNGAILNYCQWVMSLLKTMPSYEKLRQDPQYTEQFKSLDQGIISMQLDGNRDVFIGMNCTPKGFTLMRQSSEKTSNMVDRMNLWAKEMSVSPRNHVEVKPVSANTQNQIWVCYLNGQPNVYGVVTNGWTVASTEYEGFKSALNAIAIPHSSPLPGSLASRMNQNPGIFFQMVIDASPVGAMLGAMGDGKEPVAPMIIYMAGSSKDGKMALTFDCPKTLVKAVSDLGLKMAAMAAQQQKQHAPAATPQPYIPGSDK